MVLFLIILVAALLGFVLYKYSQAHKVEKQEEKKVLLDSMKDDGSSVRHAARGDFVQISAASELSLDYKEIIFEVESVHRYECDGEKWYEIEGRVVDQPYRVDWDDTDGLKISGNNQRNSLRLSDINTTEEELARMDDEESDENFLIYKDKRFYYEYSDEVFFIENGGVSGKGEREGFYSWEFVSDDNKEILSIEKWEGEPFEVWHSFIMDPTHIKVIKK